MRQIATLLFVLTFTLPSHAATIHVPADQPTIQTGIDVAVPGDTVLLAPGTYVDSTTRVLNGHSATAVAFLKSGVILESSGGAEVTFIDGGKVRHCLVAESLDGSTVVRGVSIVNGEPAGGSGNGSWGGGMLIYFSDLVIEDCRFVGCNGLGGGGILVFGDGGGRPTIRGSVFLNNRSDDLGAGIEVAFAADFLFENNTFAGNFAERAGGGILVNNSTGTVDRNIFWMNSADQEGGGLGCIGGAGPNVTGSCNLFWINTAPLGPHVQGCDVPLGADGNAELDPLFCDAEVADFRLQADSPGAPSNSGGCDLIGALPVNCGPQAGQGGVSIPELIAKSGAEVAVPILLDGDAPSNASSYQAEISYDPEILSFVRLETDGTLSDGLLVVGNETEPGTLLFAAAGTEPIVGGGVMLNMILFVSPTASNGERSPVAFESFLWNENVPPASLDDGGITVGEGLVVAGQVSYYANLNRMEGVSLVLAGDLADSTVTDVAGRYSFSGLWLGINGSVTPSFGDPSIEAVSALDASRVLEHVVQIDTLDVNQILAADLTEDGTASAEDASRILQMVVGGTVPDPLWLFVPEVIAIDSLTASQETADFAGILRGDVTGNWCPTDPCPAEGTRREDEWSVSGRWHQGLYELTVRIEQAGARGVDFNLAYDEGLLRFEGLETFGGGLWESAETAGHVAVAGATAKPWESGEAGVGLRFTSVLSPPRKSEIEITSLRIDEGPRRDALVEVPGINPPREIELVFGITVSPNPARSDVSLVIEGARGLVQIDVFDVSGRRVRSFSVEVDAMGRGLVSWNRRDGTGALVAAGIYFVKAQSTEGAITRRVVVIK